MTHSSPAYSS
ncbi:hypothetical protein Zm00014a_014422 [Zea mays]|uniref:Uncharacterized protein n=1 Tax=Zea mays TaxID=4577 RepID=A0A3L6DYR2_MAIZE|nr:hypothetical protein Zm00014a_014422 [Zea mays]